MEVTPGARFSNVPETFRARKAISKTTKPLMYRAFYVNRFSVSFWFFSHGLLKLAFRARKRLPDERFVKALFSGEPTQDPRRVGRALLRHKDTIKSILKRWGALGEIIITGGRLIYTRLLRYDREKQEEKKHSIKRRNATRRVQNDYEL